MGSPVADGREVKSTDRSACFKWLVKGTSLLVIGIGCIVTFGWLFDISVLKSVLPSWVTMKANTAIGLILSGSALRKLCRPTRRSVRQAQSLGAIVLLIGLLTLIQHGFNVNLGIDQLLFKESAAAIATSAPGRMGANTALNFLLLGSALVLLGKPRSIQPVIQVCIITAFFIALLGLLGYCYGIQEFYGFGSYTKMAIHTAISFLILCIGMLCLHPDQGIMGTITSQQAGGVMTRRLFLAVLAVPPLLSSLILAGYRAQLYSSEVGLSLSAVFSILIFAVVLWVNARALSKIDARRQRAEAERQSEARFRSLTMATSQIVWTSNSEGRVLEDSPSWRTYTGQTLEDYQGLGWLAALHPDDRDRTAKVWTQAVSAKRLYETEYRLRAADGSYRHFLIRGVPVLAADGSVQEWIGTCTDIHDRKQAEAKLREREQFLRTIYDGVASLIFVVDVLGSDQFIIREWNATTEKAVGIKSADVAGKTPEEVFGPVQGLIIRQRYQACIQTGVPITYEESIFFHGKETWWLTTYSPLKDDSDHIYRIVGTTFDIEERKQAEAALQASEARLRQKALDLETTLAELHRTQSQLVQSEKMSSLGQLVAGVAHEINNPVNFIYGNLSHANSYIQDLLDLIDLYQKYYPAPNLEIQRQLDAIDLAFLIEDLPKLLSSMKVGADRIQTIVRSLRNFSRMDEAEMKAVNIHEGIDSTLLILQNRLKDKPDHPAIEVIKEYADLPLVECYAGQLNQVFMNIISNAIDALEERDQHRSLPEIKQYPSQIRICSEKIDSGHVRVRIIDNGPGIPESIKKQLFNPFFTTKPIGKGTGLGMSISYQIVAEKHGGSLRCHSQVGQGAEFVIEIPLQQQSCLSY